MGLFTSKKNTDKQEKGKDAPKKDDGQAKKTKESMKDLYKGKVEKDVADKSKDKKVKKGSKASNAYKVLVKPLITEKVTDLGAMNKYAFEVSRSANKIEISKAIEDVYGIKPENVNIINMKGKVVTRGRYSGKRKDWKKAVITLPKGKTIQVYEGI